MMFKLSIQYQYQHKKGTLKCLSLHNAYCFTSHLKTQQLVHSASFIQYSVSQNSEQAFDSADQKEQPFHSQRVMMMLAHIVHFTAPEETAGATNPLISQHPCVILTPSLSISPLMLFQICQCVLLPPTFRSNGNQKPSVSCYLFLALQLIYIAHTYTKPLKIWK